MESLLLRNLKGVKPKFATKNNKKNKATYFE